MFTVENLLVFLVIALAIVIGVGIYLVWLYYTTRFNPSKKPLVQKQNPRDFPAKGTSKYIGKKMRLKHFSWSSFWEVTQELKDGKLVLRCYHSPGEFVKGNYKVGEMLEIDIEDFVEYENYWGD